MEKIRLKNGTEFNLIPMGIDTKNNLRIFSITSSLIQEEILASCTIENISQIKHILADNTIGATYEDCVVLKSITFVPDAVIDDNTVSDIYIVILSTDAIERGIQGASSNIQATMVTVDMLLTEFLPMLMM